ncbi:hypothetical protein [Pedobacter endophyticus]|uniref:Uncharacterized protein n=1 Tax=Pedobacter endophyticus TaxID=2789740 RepID=A0A7S9Q1E0_9SPHI|nr:hypothetical protein [Pedobacter endophyticus]QPH41662.1 hypothetical protein IZT61_10600 [Pedobacter endophyticus]
MAVLHKKEEKIQAVLGRLPKKYTDEQFVEMFIKVYSKDWGKIKSAYIKQSQDKEPGTVINMPKPEVYLKQVLANYLQQADATKVAETEEKAAEPAPVAEVKKAKAPASKKTADKEVTAEPKKAKAPAKKKAAATEEVVAETKKPKTAAKKKTDAADEELAAEKKPKAAAKKASVKK